MKPSFLKESKSHLLINEDDVVTLEKYGIDVNNYKNINELTYQINEILSNEDLSKDEEEELDYILTTLEERNYYQNINK